MENIENRGASMHRFLFFIEREFHVSLYRPLAAFIRSERLGVFGAVYLPWHPSSEGQKTFGARREVVTEYLGEDCEHVPDPVAWNPDITFMADSGYEHTEGWGLIVSIGHGTISKGSFYLDGPLSLRENAGDLICVPGEIQKEEISGWVWRQVEVTGIPKLDILSEPLSSEEKAMRLRRLGLDSERPVVLLAPTFNPEFSIMPYIRDSLRRYIPAAYNVIVKLHGISGEHEGDGEEENVCISRGYDIAELMQLADVLISDVSSVIYEFAAFGGKVLLFDSPRQGEHPKYHPSLVEYRYRDVGIRFSDPARLPELLAGCVSGPVTTGATGASLAGRFVSVRDGSSARRVVTSALALLVDPPRLGTVVILHRDMARTLELIHRCRHRFRVVVACPGAPPPTHPRISFVEWFSGGLDAVLASVVGASCEVVFVVDGRWNVSPLGFVMMAGVLRRHPGVDVVTSLRFAGESVEWMSIERWIPRVRGMGVGEICGPLTYHLPGEWRVLDEGVEGVFGFRSGSEGELGIQVRGDGTPVATGGVRVVCLDSFSWR